MDFLECLTGVDWQEEGLGVVYNLESTETGKRTCLKTATTDRENPLLPSVSDLWDIANIYEREVFDFFGIKFTGHPDMRRIFLREDWVRLFLFAGCQCFVLNVCHACSSSL